LLSLERYQNTAGTIQKREKRNGAQIADCNHKQFSFITVGASMQKDKTGSIEPTTLGAGAFPHQRYVSVKDALC
jgi:hypothetical protein